MISSDELTYELTEEDLKDFEESYRKAYREKFKGHYLEAPRTVFHDVFKEGFREGFMKSRQERVEMIRTLADHQISIDDIVKITKMKPAFVQAVLQRK